MQHFGWNSSIHINFGHLIHALLQGHMNSHSRPWASYSFGKRRRKKTKEKKRKAVSLKSRKNPTHAPKRACHARRHFASGQACDKIYNVSVSLQSWVQQCSKYVHAVQSMINLHTMMEEAGHAHAVCLVCMGSLQVCPISLDRTNTQTEKFGHFYDS